MDKQKEINEAILQCLMKLGTYFVLPDKTLIEHYDRLAELIGCEDYKTL